jgi:hypothetical protein
MEWKQKIEKWGSEAGMLLAIMSMIFWSHRGLSNQIDQIHEDIKYVNVRIDATNTRIDSMGQRIDAMGNRIDAHGTRMDHMIDNNQKILMELIKERNKK